MRLLRFGESVLDAFRRNPVRLELEAGSFVFFLQHFFRVLHFDDANPSVQEILCLSLRIYKIIAIELCTRPRRTS